LLLDGTIEYIGRKDFQLKVRGYRVELGEIENILTNYPNIKEAVVVGKGMETGETSLVAYITAKEKIDRKEIRKELASHLPDYMIPSRSHNNQYSPNGNIRLCAGGDIKGKDNTFSNNIKPEERCYTN